MHDATRSALRLRRANGAGFAQDVRPPAERQRRFRAKRGNVSRTVTRCGLIESYNELVKERSEFLDELKRLVDEVIALRAENTALRQRSIEEIGAEQLAARIDALRLAAQAKSAKAKQHADPERKRSTNSTRPAT